MVRANAFRELIAFKGTQVTSVSFHGCNCALLLDGPGICQDSSNWALLLCFFFFFPHCDKKNKLFKSFLSVPLNNGITNTVSISLPGLFSLIFVQPEVISHRLYSLLCEKISSSVSLRRLQEKCTFEMCMMWSNIFPRSSMSCYRQHILHTIFFY